MIELHKHILRLSAEIVTAQVRHNDVASDALPDLIRSVYNTLLDIGHTAPGRYADEIQLEPVEADHNDHHGVHNGATTHREHVHPTYGETVFNDHLVCMEDGLSMKMLKRHLLSVHGMTPDEYRAKWGLPADYPMVAADYAKLRSSLAVQSGLGLKPGDRAGSQRRWR